MAIDPDLTRLRKEIDRLLADKRPDRYDTEEGSEWLDEIADEVSDLVPEAEVRRLYARKIVGQQEGQATKNANNILRKIHRSGQLVLGWFGAKDDPVAVVTSTTEGKKDERVALRAMAPIDFYHFATEERRRAAGDFSSRNDACAGAEWVADQMTASGATRFETWAEEELPPTL